VKKKRAKQKLPPKKCRPSEATEKKPKDNSVCIRNGAGEKKWWGVKGNRVNKTMEGGLTNVDATSGSGTGWQGFR